MEKDFEITNLDNIVKEDKSYDYHNFYDFLRMKVKWNPCQLQIILEPSEYGMKELLPPLTFNFENIDYLEIDLQFLRTALGREGVNEFLSAKSFKKRKKLLIHSDQGGHYTSKRYQDLLKSKGVSQSMSRKGNCLDNAPIESFFGHMKDEIELDQCNTLGDVRRVIKEYVCYYNNDRPQWGLNEKTPKEYRASL